MVGRTTTRLLSSIQGNTSLEDESMEEMGRLMDNGMKGDMFLRKLKSIVRPKKVQAQVLRLQEEVSLRLGMS